MKITVFATLALIAGGTVQGKSRPVPYQADVVVCIPVGGVSIDTVLRARVITTRIYARIGVTVAWETELSACPSEGIRIDINSETPASLKPGALAYALPYEGNHICVFFDRIAADPDSDRVAVVLAHVFAHEIGHVLQGISRHSLSGIMQAHWSRRDFARMKTHSLEFEADDIQLIYLGLQQRRAAAAAMVR